MARRGGGGVDPMRDTPSDKAILFKLQKGLCYYCKRPMIRQWKHTDRVPTPALLATIDHMMPTFRGGKNTIGNKCLACYECNCRKGHMDASQYITHLRKYKEANEPQTQDVPLPSPSPRTRRPLPLLPTPHEHYTHSPGRSSPTARSSHLGPQDPAQHGRQEQAEQQGVGLPEMQSVEG
jgi:hypothetical protein